MNEEGKKEEVQSHESVSDVLAGASAFAPEKASEKPATDDKPAVEKTEAAAPSAAKDAKPEGDAKDRDEQGRFKPKDAKEEPAKEPQERPRVDVAAIMDERRKRQALEAEIAALKAGKPADKPSVFDNEDEAINQRVNEGTKGIREQFWKQSVKLARLVHKDDYDKAEAAFADAAHADEQGRLWDELRKSDDPGEFIYSMGTQIAELADVGGDLTKYREKLTGELKGQLSERDTRIKALEDEVASLKQAQDDLSKLPRSLNKQASGASPKPGDEGQDDIKTIVRFGNYQR